MIDSELSSRTFTFLFADLEGSTRLWEQFPHAMEAALARHDTLLRAAVEGSNGHVVKTTGDGLMAVFVSALDGVRACVQAQCNLREAPWGETGPLQVRMGLHTGEAQLRGGDYFGPAVNRAARLMSAAHGGQVLLSAPAASLVVDLLPSETTLRDLGEHRLKDLARPERIFQLVHPDLPVDFPPLASLDLRPNNLPTNPTLFIGREAELREITARLRSDEVRLLTLTGPGGIGKTRIGLQAAAELIDRYDDGVYFVDLSPIQDPDSVLAAVAHTIGVRETADRPLIDELKGRLRSSNMLLLLDNFEQVTQAATSVAELIRESPRLNVLVTSREALHVRGEHVFPVPPLALPAADPKRQSVEQLTQYEAVRLFIECAQAVRPDFQVSNENAPAVAEICVRLDGLPLAIELAAARIRLFSPQALLERLGSRLALLRGGARDLPLRQQALRSAIDWSYELLEPREQRMFELLSVFVGGSSFGAVEAVVSGMGLPDDGLDVLDGLASLVDKSLVRQADRDSEEPRLLMLETIREYAADRLSTNPEASAAAHRAHAIYFASFSQRQWERLTGYAREAAFDVLSSEIENVQAAWRYWVDEGDLEQLGRFVDSLWRFYDARGWYQAMIDLTNDMLRLLSSTPPAPDRIQQEIMLQTSLARALLATRGYTKEVEEAYTRALELSERAGQVPELFPVLRGLASVYAYVGEFQKATEMGEKILSLGERLGDASMQVEGHLVLGYSLAFSGHTRLGMDHLEQAVTGYDPDRSGAHRFQSGNNPGVVAFSVSALFLLMLGYPERALRRSQEAVALATRLDHPFSMAYALFHAGVLHLYLREFEAVRDCAQAVLEVAEQHEFQVWKAVATCLQGAALSGLGRPAEGLAQISHGMHIYHGLHTPPVFWPLLLQIQAEVCGQAGKPEQGLANIDEALQIIGADTKDMTSPDFYRLKGELLLALSRDRAPEAEACFERAIDDARQLELPMLELRATVSLARLWQDKGEVERAKQVLGTAYAKVHEGHATADLAEARILLSA